ncbi:MAG: EAL domain-containing protein [Sulfuricurvum sp.]|uniref:sensor domain-containing protein n=1 Tax=Sulfuricurvum sp. TaxID=2025608 RepID=UPI002632C4F2|nr:EAL domain-containing protein [Sulfuricurvum sp.]MDD2369094.1 EAL domain-containing protein [Sulfuricurvum sp.]
MIPNVKRFFADWLQQFPYPAIVMDDSFTVVLANDMAFHKLRFNPVEQESMYEYLENNSKKSFIEFTKQLKEAEYAQSDLLLRYIGESTLIGRSIDNKTFQYCFIMILPSSFRDKYTELKQKYDAILAHVSDSVIVTDNEQKIIEANNAFTKITGYELQEVLGRFPTLLSSGRHDENFYKNLFIEMQNKGYYQGNIIDRKKSGEIINALATIIPIKDSYDEIKNYIGILKDETEITKLKVVNTSTKNKDILTGVQNRESILHLIDIKCELSSPQNQVAILFIDLNKFKQVNDTYGHQYGDFVLSSAANRMKKTLRSNDLVGRYGGDEFIIMLERITKESAYEIAQKIQDALSKPYVVDEQVIDFISGSIGISFAPHDSKKASELIEKADMAMYQAKQSLSGEQIVLSDKVAEKDLNNKTLKAELVHAIDNDEIYLRIQPIVCVKSEKIVGGEVLSRWLNLNFNEVYPSTFIPLTQSLGMSKKFDIYVLNKAIKMLEEHEFVNENFFLDVNFSAEQFSDSNFITMLEDILEVKPWIKNYIVIEITESAMMVDMERTTEHLSAIRALGFKIAIDDFGTGFSSLAYLKHFSIDYLKIDKSFIDNIEEDRKDIEILKTVVTLANAIGAEVIVEGVERFTQFEIVKSIGADYIQGFYFYKPILPDAYFSKLTA